MKKYLFKLILCMLVLSMLPLAAMAETTSYYNETGLPICDEPITITVAGPQGNTTDWNDTIFVQEIEKRLGIKLVCTSYPDDVWSTQLAMMLATDTLPDMLVLCSLNKSTANEYGKEGFLLDLSQYLSLMPNFSEYLTNMPDYAAFTKTEDGEIYGIDRVRQNDLERIIFCNWIKKSWLENVNMDVPTNADELYEVLKAFKEQDANGNGDPNDEIPMSMTIDAAPALRVVHSLRTAFGIYSTEHNYQLTADEDGKVSLIEASDKWKAYLIYLNKLYEEGLLDNECFIQSQAEFREKVSKDLVGFTGDWSGPAKAMDAANNSVWLECDEILGFAYGDDDTIKYPLYPSYTNGSRVMVNANTKYPEAICRLIDYLYTPEGQILLAYGVEGISYDLEKDVLGYDSYNSTAYAEAAGFESVSEYRRQKVYINNAFTMVLGGASNTVVTATDDELVTMINDDPTYAYIADASREKTIRDNGIEAVEVFPFLAYTDEEASERASLVADITSYLQTMKAQFITGEVDIESNWEGYLSTLDNMKLGRLMEIEQAAYDRYSK